MSRYFTPSLGRLEPYVPGEQPKIQNLIKLNTNENPYPLPEGGAIWAADCTAVVEGAAVDGGMGRRGRRPVRREAHRTSDARGAKRQRQRI